MSQQSKRQQSFREHGGSTQAYEGDTHAAATASSVPYPGTHNERLLQLANATLGTSYGSLPAALQAWAEAEGATNWSSTGALTFGITASVADGTPNPQTEGANQITFTVSLTEPPVGNVTFDALTVDDTAIAGTDYTKIGPPAVQYTIVAPATSVDVVVDLLGPTAGWAPDRRFFLDISNVQGNAGGDPPGLGRSRATGNITDSSVEPTFAINPAGSPDPAEQNVDTNIKHNAGLTGSTTTHDVTFDFGTRDGTARAGQDYVAKSGTATLTGGNLTIDTQIDLIAGDTVTGIENYFLDISNVRTNGYLLTVTNSTSQGRIMEQGYLAPPLNLQATGASGAINLTWDDNRL